MATLLVLAIYNKVCQQSQFASNVKNPVTIRVQITDEDMSIRVLVQEYGTYNKYLESMSTSGTWGESLTLAGAATVYRRPITVVFDTGSTSTINSPNSSPGAAPITLGYIAAYDSLMRLHYISLTPIASCTVVAYRATEHDIIRLGQYRVSNQFLASAIQSVYIG